MNELYSQCVLRKGNTRQVAWVPVEFAVINKYVSLETDKEWEDGWQVIEASKVKLDRNTLLERSQDYKRTRKASDI